jgi:hypothetical protein
MDPNRPINTQIIENLNLRPADYAAVLDGVIDSDLGKLTEYKSLFTEQSERSNAFLDFLKLNGDAGQILSKLTGGRPLLNSATSNDELRTIFKDKIRGAPGYLHDLPGLYAAVEDFYTGTRKGDARYLEMRLSANLHHNGPDAGFWAFLKEKLIFGKQVEADAEKMLKGTIYDSKPSDSFAVENLSYPNPVAEVGQWHRVFDRLSQATRGGHSKIYFEARVFNSPAQLLSDFLGPNPDGTIAQLELCKSQTKLPQITQLIEQSIVQIQKYKAALHELKPSFSTEKADLTKVFTGDSFMRDLTTQNESSGGRYKALIDYFQANSDTAISQLDSSGERLEFRLFGGNPMGENSDLNQIYGDQRSEADTEDERQAQTRSASFDPNRMTPSSDIASWQAYAEGNPRSYNKTQIDILKTLEQNIREFEQNRNPDLQKNIIKLQIQNQVLLREVEARSRASRVRR